MSTQYSHLRDGIDMRRFFAILLVLACFALPARAVNIVYIIVDGYQNPITNHLCYTQPFSIPTATNNSVAIGGKLTNYTDSTGTFISTNPLVNCIWQCQVTSPPQQQPFTILLPLTLLNDTNSYYASQFLTNNPTGIVYPFVIQNAASSGLVPISTNTGVGYIWGAVSGGGGGNGTVTNNQGLSATNFSYIGSTNLTNSGSMKTGGLNVVSNIIVGSAIINQSSAYALNADGSGEFGNASLILSNNGTLLQTSTGAFYGPLIGAASSATNSTNVAGGTVSGNGAGLTNLTATNLSGIIATNNLPNIGDFYIAAGHVTAGGNLGQLVFYYSADGLGANLLSKPGYFGNTTNGSTCRDCSLLHHLTADTNFAVAYTEYFGAGGTFGICKTPDFKQVNYLVSVPVTTSNSNARVYAPEFYSEGTNDYIIVSVSVNAGSAFHIELFHANDSSLTSWTDVGNLVNNASFDGFIYKRDGQYRIYTSTDSGGYLYTNSSLAPTFVASTALPSLNPAGYEGPSIIDRNDGSTIAYIYATPTFPYDTSAGIYKYVLSTNGLTNLLSTNFLAENGALLVHGTFVHWTNFYVGQLANVDGQTASSKVNSSLNPISASFIGLSTNADTEVVSNDLRILLYDVNLDYSGVNLKETWVNTNQDNTGRVLLHDGEGNPIGFQAKIFAAQSSQLPASALIGTVPLTNSTTNFGPISAASVLAGSGTFSNTVASSNMTTGSLTVSNTANITTLNVTNAVVNGTLNIAGTTTFLGGAIVDNGLTIGGGFTNLAGSTAEFATTGTATAINITNAHGVGVNFLRSSNVWEVYSNGVLVAWDDTNDNLTGFNFNGNGSGLTSLNASSLASGTVPGAALGNSALLAGNQTIAGTNHFTGASNVFDNVMYLGNDQRMSNGNIFITHTGDGVEFAASGGIPAIFVTSGTGGLNFQMGGGGFLFLGSGTVATMSQAGIFTANGIGNTATNTYAVTAGGITNLSTSKDMRIPNFAGTSVVLSNSLSKTSITIGTVTSGLQILHVNESLTGTLCSGTGTD